MKKRIEELENALKDVSRQRDHYLQECTRLSVEAQSLVNKRADEASQWHANFSQEADFYRALAERADNRARTIARVIG